MKEIWLITTCEDGKTQAFVNEGDAVQTCYNTWSQQNVDVSSRKWGYAVFIKPQDDDLKLVARIEKLELFHEPNHL